MLNVKSAINKSFSICINICAPSDGEIWVESFGCDVRNRDGFWPSSEVVNCSEAECVSC
jgi:hypothetical protein